MSAIGRSLKASCERGQRLQLRTHGFLCTQLLGVTQDQVEVRPYLRLVGLECFERDIGDLLIIDEFGFDKLERREYPGFPSGATSMSINYRELRAALRIEDVLSWTSWTASRRVGDQLGGPDPFCARDIPASPQGSPPSAPRTFSVNVERNIFR